jgi:hypothetical protein
MINVTIDGRSSERGSQRHRTYFNLCDAPERLFKLFNEGSPMQAEIDESVISPLVYADVKAETLPPLASLASYTSPTIRYFCCRLLARLYCYEEIPRRYCPIIPHMIRIVRLHEAGMFDPEESQKSIDVYIEKYEVIPN